MFVVRHADPAASTPELLAFWNASLRESFPLDERLWRQQLALEKDETVLLAAFEPAAFGPASAAAAPVPAPAQVGAAAPKAAEPRDRSPSLAELSAEFGSLAGLALVKRAARPGPDGAVPAKGNLSFILVREESRGRGAGGALLDCAQDWLRERGATRLHLGRDTYHYFPGAPLEEGELFSALLGFLGAKGFVAESDEHDLCADLGELDLKGLAAKLKRAPGYVTVGYESVHRASLERFFLANFPGRWFSDTFEAIDAGMRGTDLLLLREEPSGEIVGFSRIYDSSSPILGPGVYWRALMGDKPCGLGPIGVDESRRGAGLGMRLLYDSMVRLAAKGCRTMVIDWTDLVGFYAKMGFAIWKSYRLMTKQL
ncbi:MAG: GNAT family N-acetyltransferase [Spirochaetaceae bacterium]|nr:GNAT family N-acetyltransferase [Spirochaetaceae bacterium]